ncbi:MAG TPA: hypothetical protein VMU66_07460, partial [Gaiellales bacterium]|nr:hypothetical protein [Gaiellales bacterium]
MDYVSPIDPRTVRVQPPAMRPGSLAGRTVVLLDITKHRGAEFLDHVERLLQGHDARTLRRSKQTFSRP